MSASPFVTRMVARGAGLAAPVRPPAPPASAGGVPELAVEEVETVAPICEAIDKYMSTIDSRKLDRAGEMPPELLQSLREMGLFGVIVHTGNGCSWTTSSNASWLHVAPGSGANDTPLVITVDANSGAARTGTTCTATAARSTRRAASSPT